MLDAIVLWFETMAVVVVMTIVFDLVLFIAIRFGERRRP